MLDTVIIQKVLLILYLIGSGIAAIWLLLAIRSINKQLKAFKK